VRKGVRRQNTGVRSQESGVRSQESLQRSILKTPKEGGTITAIMQLTIDIGYDQLFELVRQLPAMEKERFVKERAKPEQDTQGDWQQRSAVLGHPKCSREEWQQILANTPTLGPEDAHALEESMNNFRKEFNNAFERRSLGLVGAD